MQSLRLDDLYKMVAQIYSEQNALRSTAATLAHFAEACGMLTVHDRMKKREGFTVVDALCKALGWYFPLLAKMRVRSVEELIYRKYPYACPYCRKIPHAEAECKTVRGTERTVNHAALRKLYDTNSARCPTGLNEWQKMFQEIYPRSTEDRGRSTLGLFEELGELCEAVRVFDQYPKYFAGEAADVFSYLMGIANEYTLRVAQEEETEFSLRRALLHEEYEIIHFAGHANEKDLVFEELDGSSVFAPLNAFAELIKRHGSVKCVVLNACKSLASLSTSIAPYTIGMEENIDDDVAIEFARGFYDAVAANKGFEAAIREGKSAAELKGKGSPPIKVIRG